MTITCHSQTKSDAMSTYLGVNKSLARKDDPLKLNQFNSRVATYMPSQDDPK